MKGHLCEDNRKGGGAASIGCYMTWAESPWITYSLHRASSEVSIHIVAYYEVIRGTIYAFLKIEEIYV